MESVQNSMVSMLNKVLSLNHNNSSLEIVLNTSTCLKS